MMEFTYDWKPEDYPDEPILKITKSSLGSHQWCPKKYDFNYRERLPQDTTEAMTKGTIIHNAREDFFNSYDMKKAEDMGLQELIDYNYSLYPIDDYTDVYYAMACFDANRLMDAREADKVDEYMPVLNEVKLDAEFHIRARAFDHVELKQNYTVHLQGIIDRLFFSDGGYIPMELKTGAWGKHKATSMRKEMAFYKLLFDEATDEHLIEQGIDPQYEMTHWGWYFPVSNHIQVEKVKKISENAMLKSLATLIHSYETNVFEAKYNERTCASCSYFSICPAADMAGWV
tara:strand:- start:327 stop:1187 length:861 start_codon:yes stop_codon:yes gene_type:complete